MVYGEGFDLFIPDVELLLVIDGGPLLLNHSQAVQIELKNGECLFHA